jgi:DNA-binding NarL/FixJ family response regulator
LAAHNLRNGFSETGLELRVFLVEDLQRMRGLLTDLFASLGGFRVVAAASTEAEARLWLDDNPRGWDLAVVDLVLEQGAGMNVISRCREQPDGGRIVVFSSYASPGVRQHCLDLGADAVFEKSETEAFISWCDDLASRENSGP